MTETEQLRSRIDDLVATLGDQFPKQKLARALVAKACDVSLADVGPMSTIWMTEHATGLLAGHWSPPSIETFIDTKR